MVSFSLPPNSRSRPPRPSSVSLPESPKSWSAPAPPSRVSLPAPPNRFALGSAPLAWLSVIASWPPRPKTRIRAVLATVGVPPEIAIAPLLTRSLPAASRLIVIVLSALSPNTLSTPDPGLKVAVVAALAGELVPASTPAASTAPATSRRARRRPFFRLGFIVSSFWRDPDPALGGRVRTGRFRESDVAFGQAAAFQK